MKELAALPVRLRAPVAPEFRAKLPLPLAVMVMVLLVSVEVMSVPMVPLKTKPLVRVPAVCLTWIPLVVVPAPVWLKNRPLAMVLAALAPFRSRISTEAVATFKVWLMMAAVAPVVALLVELMVRPSTLAAVGEITLLLGVPAALPVGTWTIQVEQEPAEIQLKVPVEAPPSVDRTVPAAPSAVGNIYVTAALVVLEDSRVVLKAEVLAKTRLPWVVLALPKVSAPPLDTLKTDEVMVRALPEPSVQVEGEAPVKLSAPEELSVTTPEPLPMLLVPVELNVVKAPEAAVVAPIWVALIPVAVVLKVEAPVPEVMVRALVP